MAIFHSYVKLPEGKYGIHIICTSTHILYIYIYYLYTYIHIYIYVCIVIEIDHRVYQVGGVLVLVGAESTYIYIYTFSLLAEVCGDRCEWPRSDAQVFQCGNPLLRAPHGAWRWFEGRAALLSATALASVNCPI